MTAFDWAVGWIVTGVGGVLLVGGARRLRRRLVPGLGGPEGTLAVAIVALATLTAVGLLLGTVGWFATAPVLGGLAVVRGVAERVGHPGADPAARCASPDPAGVGDDATAADGVPVDDTGSTDGAHAPAPGATGSAPGDEDDTTRAHPGRRRVLARAARHWPAIAAFATVAAVSFTWLGYVVAAYRIGSSDGDSLMYHLPFAARFVQSGSVTEIPAIGPDMWVGFYPANAELLQATLMLPFGADVLVPVVSLGWLALALVAGWCLGNHAGRGPLGLVLAALPLAVPIMTATQAGSARVDAAGLALVLAAAALVLRAPRTVGSCTVAGLALGLALGTKMTLLPVGGLALVSGALVLARRHGARHAGAWTAATGAAGAFWYLRNLVVAGNPVPAVRLGIGPVGFAPLPDDVLERLDDSSVTSQLGRSGFVGETLEPAIDLILPSVPIAVGVAAVAVAAAILAIRVRPLGPLHALVVSGVGACVAYAVAPNSAPVRSFDVKAHLDEVIVGLNARYLLPGLALVLCLAPTVLGRWRRTAGVLTVLAAGLTIWSANRRLGGEWPLSGGDLAIAGAVTVAGAAMTLAVLTGRPRRWRAAVAGRAAWVGAAGAVACGAALVAVTWPVVADDARHDYASSPPESQALWHAVGDGEGRRVAVVGDWIQYPLVGGDLANTVEYLSRPQDRGLWQLPETCGEMHRMLRAGSYDILVVQRRLFDRPDALADEIGWARAIPRSTILVDNEVGVAVSLPRDPAPATAGCP